MSTEPSSKGKPFFKNWVFWWCVVAGIIVLGQIGKKTEKHGDQATRQSEPDTTVATTTKWKPTKSNITGLYFWQRGAEESTIQFYFGGMYELKDMIRLPGDGTSLGNWALQGDTITIFTDGMKTGEGTVYEDRVVLGSRTYWKQ